jgi:hypothetical protein
MSCEIIQFSTAARVSLKRCKSIVRAAGTSRMSRVDLEQEPERPVRDDVELSTTCKNSRLRQMRDEAWNRARQTTSYWRARLDWHIELEWAQKRGLADSGSFPPADDENRYSLVDTWRVAVVKQLLTPAPNVAAVAWKRAKFSGSDFCYFPVKPERVERVIADDEAFLAAHPIRRSNSEAMAHRRDLSDEEIRPVLRLKHREIANFTEKHGVNVGWLLEGKGRIFKKDPIGLGPNMTGGELAAVVAKMPEADQQAIRATVREIFAGARSVKRRRRSHRKRNRQRLASHARRLRR